MTISKKTAIFSCAANFILVGSGFVIAEGWKGFPKEFGWFIPFIAANVWRAEIGAIWAILLMTGSYVHLFKTIQRKGEKNRGLRSLSSLSDDQFLQLTQLVMTATVTQLSLCKGTPNPEKLKDDWSLGYVYGIVDTWLQLLTIAADEDATTFMKLVFSKTFGDEFGEDLFNKSTILTTIQIPEFPFILGSRRAHEDTLECIRSRGPLKLSWAEYLET